MPSSNIKHNYDTYEQKYDFSLTKNGRKLNTKTNTKKQKKKQTNISCYSSKHVRVKMNKIKKN